MLHAVGWTVLAKLGGGSCPVTSRGEHLCDVTFSAAGRKARFELDGHAYLVATRFLRGCVLLRDGSDEIADTDPVRSSWDLREGGRTHTFVRRLGRRYSTAVTLSAPDRSESTGLFLETDEFSMMAGDAVAGRVTCSKTPPYGLQVHLPTLPLPVQVLVTIVLEGLLGREGD